jgi:chromosome segregation ATPase
MRKKNQLNNLNQKIKKLKNQKKKKKKIKKTKKKKRKPTEYIVIKNELIKHDNAIHHTFENIFPNEIVIPQ